jgi:dGTPase
LFDRKTFEEREFETLARYAMKSRESRGRYYPEPEHPLRTAFQRDKDRIIHSTAFRRLEYKTQVFLNHEGDHYRTRLTHTMEVAQISRTAARILGLNEDLTEAVALAHDIGHTCFGHVGEDILNGFLADVGGFEHNAQALRIVERLESRYPAFPGLNLTYEVRRGLTKKRPPYGGSTLDPKDCATGASLLETQVVDIADQIAYTSHDFDDGLNAGLIALEDLVGLSLWGRIFDHLREVREGMNDRLTRYQGVRYLIELLVSDLVHNADKNIRAGGIESLEDVRERGDGIVALSPTMGKDLDALKQFLRANLYGHATVRAKTDAGKEVLRNLFAFYLDHTDEIPAHTRERIGGETGKRLVGDYLAGMTDRFALERHREHFGRIPPILEEDLRGRMG